jgi:hypothetical protein
VEEEVVVKAQVLMIFPPCRSDPSRATPELLAISRRVPLLSIAEIARQFELAVLDKAG